MERETPAPWTLEELAAEVEAALAAAGVGQRSGRVSEVPRPRDIRYYATLGLVDRPAGWRGRTALYGPRHLLQLVALKRLQAQGLPLAAIQERLAGLPPSRLEVLAALPPPEARQAASAPRPPPPAPAGPPAPPRAFWKAAPAPAPRAEAPAAVPPEGPAVRALQAVPLAPHAQLLLEELPSLTPEEVAALREAAAPLLAVLARLTRAKETP